MKRQIIKIDEDKCNGCGECIPNCHEGALQIVDGKARLISDLMCDGLGACLGHCPLGAIEVEEREADAYDEVKVMAENIVPAGENTIKAHLNHLKDHNEMGFFKQAIDYLNENNIPVPSLENEVKPSGGCGGGCPGSQMVDMRKETKPAAAAPAVQETTAKESHLQQWPVQFHLCNARAPYFQKSDLLISADCVAYSVADFQNDFLKGKSLVIACPKLDSDTNRYVDKMVAMIDEAQVNTITVMIMEVPCCGGLISMIQQAQSRASRKVPVKKIMISIKGDVLSEEWI